MVRAVVKFSNSMLSVIIALALLLAGAYAAYCLWDNQQIYVAADKVQSELLALKPKAKEVAGESGPTFDDLLALNPDVRGWVSMDGTKIDHPVLQGRSNMDYLNMDVYGRFALAGSIFLDSRNASDFSDRYCILYGHHMEKSAMFGDLDKYLDKVFFDSNDSGELLIPGKSFSLKVFACIQTKASDENVFDPDNISNNIDDLLDFARTESVNFSSEKIDSIRAELEAGTSVQVLALTTCSSNFTDARTIVLTVMTEEKQEGGGDTVS